jgi:hypothetical protein
MPSFCSKQFKTHACDLKEQRAHTLNPSRTRVEFFAQAWRTNTGPEFLTAVTITSSSSSLALHPCVGLGLLYGPPP